MSRSSKRTNGIGLGVLSPRVESEMAKSTETGIIWGFPKIRGTISGVPIRRIIVLLGLYWGSFHFGKLPYRRLWVYGKQVVLSWLCVIR